MKKIIAILIIGFLAVNMNQANAQVVKKFLDKRKATAKEATDERVGEEADKAVVKGVNKQLDKIFGNSDDETTETPAVETESESNKSSSSSSSPSGIGMNALLSGMGMSSTANVKDSYDFDAYIEMTITSFDKSGEEDESGKYISYIDADSPDYGMSITEEGEEDVVLMIFDTENSLMLTLSESDGEKVGFAVAFDEEQMEAISESYEEEEEAEVETNPYDIKKTGKTKKILGYKCDEYQTEDETSIVNIWVTDDLGKKIDNTFMRSSNFSGLFFYAYYTDGFVLEYIIKDKEDDEKTVMTVTDIDVDNKTSIKTAGYTIMNIGAMQMEEEE